MQIGINCKTLKSAISFSQLIETVSSASFAGLEFKMQDVIDYSSIESLDRVKDLFLFHNIIPISFVDGLYYGLLGPSREHTESVIKWKKYCKIANFLGCNLATLVINPRTDMAANKAYILSKSRLKELADIAREYNIEIAIEALGIKKNIPTRLNGSNQFIDKVSQASELVSSVDSKNVGIVLDIFHWYVSGGDLKELQDLRPGMIKLMHINDAPAGSPYELKDSQRVLPGEGVINLASVFENIGSSQYSGFLSVEIFNQNIWEMEQLKAANRVYQSVKNILPYI